MKKWDGVSMRARVPQHEWVRGRVRVGAGGGGEGGGVMKSVT